MSQSRTSHIRETSRSSLAWCSVGWLGTGGLLCGILALILVLVPPGSVAPELAAIRNSFAFIVTLHAVLVTGHVLALSGIIFSAGKVTSCIALALLMAAAITGNTTLAAPASGGDPIFFGLDFFVINVIFKAILFLPLERWFPHRAGQSALRPELREDLFYYLVGSLILQVLAFLTMAPAKAIAGVASLGALRETIGSLPFALQLFLIMLFTDFVQYWMHRTFHRVPVLWRFHAVHHSAQHLDWLATTRLHYVENIVLRCATTIPVLASGFSLEVIQSYFLLLFFYSSLQHANIGWDLRLVERFLTTPRYHHWHHGIEKEATDINFAIHFPFLDRLFGTHYMPEKAWPKGYGIAGHPVPTDQLGQFLYPFQRDEAETEPAATASSVGQSSRGTVSP